MRTQNDNTKMLTKAGEFGPVTLTVTRFDVRYRNGFSDTGPYAIARQTSYTVSGDGLGNMSTTRARALRRWKAV